MEKFVTKVDLAKILLKQAGVTTQLYALFEVDRTDSKAFLKARDGYFEAQNEILALAYELIRDE